MARHGNPIWTGLAQPSPAQATAKPARGLAHLVGPPRERLGTAEGELDILGVVVTVGLVVSLLDHNGGNEFIFLGRKVRKVYLYVFAQVFFFCWRVEKWGGGMGGWEQLSRQQWQKMLVAVTQPIYVSMRAENGNGRQKM